MAIQGRPSAVGLSLSAPRCRPHADHLVFFLAAPGFWKKLIPNNFGQIWAKIQQNSDNIFEILKKSAPEKKNQQDFRNFHENFEIRERCELLTGLSFSRFLLFRGCFGQVCFPQFSIMDSKTVQRSALCRSRRELSNEYLLFTKLFTCKIWLR